MFEPTDAQLYNKIKDEVDKSYDKPSAYRSMAYTRFYIKAFKEKYGDDKKPYAGKKPGELKSWRNDKWIDVRSLLKDPKNPVPCGLAEHKPGQYPFCLPLKKALTYSMGELQLLVNRKDELGKRRLVSDAYLRDVLTPDKTPQARVYKQKYVPEKKLRIKPIEEAKAKKILDEEPLSKLV